MKIKVTSTSPFDQKKHVLHELDIEIQPQNDVAIDLDSMKLAVPFSLGDDVLGFWFDGKFYLAGMPLDIKPGEMK